VALSSNKWAASVPSSVAVPLSHCATSRRTEPRDWSTSVTISAAYAGVTRAASLTVTPPPLPTFFADAQPDGVIGGAQSSTGAVTLSAPAPQVVRRLRFLVTTGGSVPSSVAVSAGVLARHSRSAPVAVAASDHGVAISAAYGGLTRSASLTVTPTTSNRFFR